MPMRKKDDIPPAQLTAEQVQHGLEVLLKITAKEHNCTVNIYNFYQKTKNEMENNYSTFILVENIETAYKAIID